MLLGYGIKEKGVKYLEEEAIGESCWEGSKCEEGAFRLAMQTVK
jgi:hypothetical protein